MLLLSLFFLLLISIPTSAQYKLMGDGAYMDNGCIRLTADEPYSEGIAYNTSRLNLNHPFEIEFDIYLGDKDEWGADGITFVIHNDERGFEAFGTYGECLGYGRWRREYLGGNYIAQGNIDLVNDIFKGKSSVIWGFTASTGNKYNLQYFCLKRLAYAQ